MIGNVCTKAEAHGANISDAGITEINVSVIGQLRYNFYTVAILGNPHKLCKTSSSGLSKGCMLFY